MTDITPSTVAAMLEGVTDGPWAVDGPPWNQAIWSSAENRVAFMAHSNGLNDDRDIATARFIAYAREAVPAMSAERDALSAKLADVTAASTDKADAWDAVAKKNARIAVLEADASAARKAAADNFARAESAEARNAALKAEVERLRGAALALQKDMMQRAEMRINGRRKSLCMASAKA